MLFKTHLEILPKVCKVAIYVSFETYCERSSNVVHSTYYLYPLSHFEGLAGYLFISICRFLEIIVDNFLNQFLPLPFLLTILDPPIFLKLFLNQAKTNFSLYLFLSYKSLTPS